MRISFRLILTLCLAIIALPGCSSSSTSSPNDDPELSAIQDCIDTWNGQPGSDGDLSAYETQGASSGSIGRVMLSNWRDYEWTAYISVGFAEDFPDRCLVTAASPDGPQMAVQFVQQSNGKFMIVNSGSRRTTINDLPESVKKWNAEALSNGDLVMQGVGSSANSKQSEDSDVASDTAANTYVKFDEGQALQEPIQFSLAKEVYTDLKWTNWGARETTATGTYEANSCDPNCAEGEWVIYPLAITLSDPRECGSKTYYQQSSAETTDESGEKFEFELPVDAC